MSAASASTGPRFLVDGQGNRGVDPADRGLCLGDGLFETIAIRGGRARFWDRHMARLARGCARLGLPAPDVATLERECTRLVADDPVGTLRLTLTRGVGPRGYAPPADPAPTRILAFHPGSAPATTPSPLQLRWCETRLAVQPRLAGLKHLGRLEQVLARAEWNDPCIDEGIMQSVDGRVIECTSANLFLVRQGRVITPDLADCGVAGVVRGVVLDTAADAGIETEVRDVARDEIAAAEELFVTSATRAIAAVGAVAERRYEAPGPVTHMLDGHIDWMDQR